MNGLVKEPPITVDGHTFVVISKTVVGSHQHEHCICLIGDKSPVALIRQDQGRDEIIHILDEQIERGEIEKFITDA